LENALIGAILPDCPMFAFYFIEKVVRDIPEKVIWTESYLLSALAKFLRYLQFLSYYPGRFYNRAVAKK